MQSLAQILSGNAQNQAGTSKPIKCHVHCNVCKKKSRTFFFFVKQLHSHAFLECSIFTWDEFCWVGNESPREKQRLPHGKTGNDANAEVACCLRWHCWTLLFRVIIYIYIDFLICLMEAVTYPPYVKKWGWNWCHHFQTSYTSRLMLTHFSSLEISHERFSILEEICQNDNYSSRLFPSSPKLPPSHTCFSCGGFSSWENERKRQPR